MRFKQSEQLRSGIEQIPFMTARPLLNGGAVHLASESDYQDVEADCWYIFDRVSTCTEEIQEFAAQAFLGEVLAKGRSSKTRQFDPSSALGFIFEWDDSPTTTE